MTVYLYIVWIVILVSTLVTYFVQRKRGAEPHLSRKYIGKYYWIFQKLTLPLIAIYALLLDGFKAYCLTLLTIIFINALYRKLFKITKKYGVWVIVQFSISLGLIITSYGLDEPFWIQIGHTLFGLVFAIWSLGAVIINMPKFGPLYLIERKLNINRKAWRLVNFGLVVFGIVVVVLNEYFRRSTSLEVWALFHAFGLMCLLALSTIFIMPIVLKFSAKDQA